MERALQDEVWSMLPKEFKEEVKKEYKQPTKTEYEQGYDNALRNYFGHHNLTSDDNANANAKAEPKKFFDSDYSIGDKVVVNISSLGNPRKEVVTLVRQYQPVCEYSYWEKTWVIQARDGMTYQSKESHFEPYTEPTEPKSDDMEEKDLRLDELLKDHIGEEIYSPTFGIVQVTLANCNAIGVISPWNNAKRTFDKDGRYWDKSDAVVSLFPSRDLYLKYPLDARAAWMEWEQANKPKVELRVSYTIKEKIFNGSGSFSLTFNSQEEAQQAVEAAKKALEQFQNRNQQ